MVAEHEAATGQALLPGDPERLLLQAVAAEVARARVQINDAALQTLIDTARGAFLDSVTALLGAVRKQPQAAAAEIRLYRLAGSQGAVVVPAGTRLAISGIVFETTAAATIGADLAFVDAGAVAIDPGSVANGLLGTPSYVADRPEGAGAVELLALTAGGSDTETDDELRARAVNALAVYAAAGPADAYRQLALAAHPDVALAGVVSPKPGRVTVVVAGRDGAELSADVLASVTETLTADDVRPICDTVTVARPTATAAALTLTWYGEVGRNATLDETQAAVLAAVDAYRTWQGAALGRDIVPSRLVADVQNVVGVQRCTVAGAARPVGPTSLAVVSVTVAYGGAEG